MDSQRIPEHKLNYTKTIDEALENIENNPSNAIATEKTKTTKATRVHSNEAK